MRTREIEVNKVKQTSKLLWTVTLKIDYFIKILTKAHGVIRALSNSKDMWGHLITPLGSVQANSSHGVDRKPLVGVHGDTEKTRVGLKKTRSINDKAKTY